MQGLLRLNPPDGPVEKSARVVEYGGGVAYSWHGHLEPFDHQPGVLTLDDGRTFTVVVDGSWLRPVDAEPQASASGSTADSMQHQ